ncbi:MULTISPECIES: carboxylesterase/lipase family protein [Actinoalloteichus]|uniref:Carboxylic ester hydrolase n=1 Tax=Actinoalloteichus fjordicus TaxID=1612552 RepID=A0AAC9PSR0_9PSEU|nr:MULTISPECIES: carboxylesterase family protein [Actinoalloteichus]APU15398.1 carboxylesterase type B [Actinoalloteichus fjordicus]APU21465.1 carboxylesterase type B [Actinoalloteichus sp. GBA129-24]
MSRVRTDHGVVEGVESGGLHLFRNIPFAAPPFGRRRFRPPVPPEPWDGVRDGTRSGPAAPQPAGQGLLGSVYAPQRTGADCLTLEVCTPDPGTTGLPVMVHVHGGAYVYGAGSAPGFRGHTFARHGIVHVGVNYRLGVDGFLYLGAGADNLGLRDQTAALEWVHRNIAAFGGDPGQVTIFGQSGGAVSVFTHLAMPASRGLFTRAIAQSGHPAATVGPDEAMRITRHVARRLGVAATVEGLRDVPIARTVAATEAALAGFGRNIIVGDRRSLLLSPFRAIHDTETLPTPPGRIAGTGTASDVPVLTGTVRNEAVDIITAMASSPFSAPLIRRGLRSALGIDRTLRDAYRDGPRRITDPSALIEAAWTDWAFRMPTLRFAVARAAPTWIYEFRWQSEARPPLLGASHGIDLCFVRDDVDLVATAGKAGRELLGARRPHGLATAMHDAWVRFVRSGDPGWPRYESRERATMVFDTSSHVVADAAGAERRVWEGRALHGL